MPCPYFLPTLPRQSTTWAKPPRVPLGEIYAGVCCAGESRFEPDENALCNSGYASECCSHFPAGAECDAMRYSISTADDTMVVIQFILEKDHGPLRHGRAEYAIERKELSGLEGVAAAQGRAFVQSFLRRRVIA